MKNAVIIGFGGMGCRHTQSLINTSQFNAIFILEPSDHVFEKNSDLIGIKNYNNIYRIKALKEVLIEIDIIILATLADIRFQYFKESLALTPRFILLEKVIFQSKVEFQNSIDLLQQKSVRVFGNLPRRYFKNYNLVKSKNLDINKVSITGPDFGLLCNSIHYIDLVQYLTNERVIKHCASMGWCAAENKRGATFLEGEGTLIFTTEKGVVLEIVSDSKMYTDLVVEIRSASKIFRFNESKCEGLEISDKGIEQLDFHPIYSSILTAKALDDMYSESCLFPELQELSSSHIPLFEAVKTLTGVTTKRLPIT